jgi:hypothetical protein
MLVAARRDRVVELLDTGMTPVEVIDITGEKFQNVYRWRAQRGHVSQ